MIFIFLYSLRLMRTISSEVSCDMICSKLHREFVVFVEIWSRCRMIICLGFAEFVGKRSLEQSRIVEVAWGVRSICCHSRWLYLWVPKAGRVIELVDHGWLLIDCCPSCGFNRIDIVCILVIHVRHVDLVVLTLVHVIKPSKLLRVLPTVIFVIGIEHMLMIINKCLRFA